MDIEVARERPDSADARQLIAELEAVLDPLYPAESRHGYSVEKLLNQQVAFFVVRLKGEAVACGGVQLFEGYGEVKRMYVRPALRGSGLGRRILDRLASHCRENGLRTMRLETGIYQHEAIRLYERYGFRRIGPFGEYTDDPNSVYMELAI